MKQFLYSAFLPIELVLIIVLSVLTGIAIILSIPAALIYRAGKTIYRAITARVY